MNVMGRETIYKKSLLRVILVIVIEIEIGTLDSQRINFLFKST